MTTKSGIFTRENTDFRVKVVLRPPLSTNGPHLGHLFGFKYFDKINLMYMINPLFANGPLLGHQ